MKAKKGQRVEMTINEFIKNYLLESFDIWPDNGIGYIDGHNNVNDDKLFNRRDGSCAQRSYLLHRRAIEHGFHARRVGLWSNYGANDVAVEIQLDDAANLLLPSVKAYYPHSLNALISRPQLAKRDDEDVYTVPRFYQNLTRVDYYFTLNECELDLSGAAKLKGTNLFPYPHDACAAYSEGANYVAGLHGLWPQDIEWEWEETVSPYRIWIQWYGEDAYSDSFVVEADQGHGYKTVAVTPLCGHQRGNEYQVGFPRLENVSRLRLRFYSAKGQNRVLINRIGIY